MSEIGVYVHVPFCVRKCIYCDFVSTTRSDLVESYFKALVKDVKLSGFLDEENVKTLYFGGGTPSLIDEKFLNSLIVEISRISKFEPEEITVELNPESTTIDKIKGYISMGVNRASLGVQAFDEEVLKISQRPHGTDEVLKAASILRENFENVNFDFIVGLPMYTFKTVEENLKLVEKFKPEHVSVYMLELDHDTPLRKLVDSGRLKIPEEIPEMFDLMREGLESMGYVRYEISNFSKPGFESKHNLMYWRNFNYAGFGVSAGGHIGRLRYVRTLSLEEYIENPLKNSYERLNDDIEELAETLFMGLRLIEGIDLKDLRLRFGSLVEDFLEHVEPSEFFSCDGERLRLTEIGIDRSKESLGEVVEWLYNHKRQEV